MRWARTRSCTGGCVAAVTVFCTVLVPPPQPAAARARNAEIAMAEAALLHMRMSIASISSTIPSPARLADEELARGAIVDLDAKREGPFVAQLESGREYRARLFRAGDVGDRGVGGL